MDKTSHILLKILPAPGSGVVGGSGVLMLQAGVVLVTRKLYVLLIKGSYY